MGGFPVLDSDKRLRSNIVSFRYGTEENDDAIWSQERGGDV